MKRRLTNLLLILVFIVGLFLLLYPTVSDYWNSMHQSRAIASYAENVANLDEEVYEEYWAAAEDYNFRLLDRKNPYLVTEQQLAEYNSLLNLDNSGIMGYVEIPKIECTAPIYHGTSESVLQVAIGHLDWTSLPTGGESTHCVISGHRGLPSARLFTDLDRMEVGDVFMLQIMNETLTYQVDQILIVEPDDTKALLIQEGKDYCTLVTCTPYGVNSHRMLVRGVRIENAPEAISVRVTADALLVEPLIVATVLAVPLLILLVLLVFVDDGVRKRKKK